MGFFKKALGSDYKETAGNFDGNSFELIPDGTTIVAYVDSAGWDNGAAEFDLERHIKIQWKVVGPEKYAGRVLFHKVRIESGKEAQKIKALQMLQAIDDNCGGKISKHDGELDDMVLQTSLMQKPMGVRVRVWEMNGKQGNWIDAVSPKPSGTPAVDVPKTEPFDPDTIPF